ncbi:MAG: hypothetical protein R3C20_17800 [Planctomycetaceae bacterium]
MLLEFQTAISTYIMARMICRTANGAAALTKPTVKVRESEIQFLAMDDRHCDYRRQLRWASVSSQICTKDYAPPKRRIARCLPHVAKHASQNSLESGILSVTELAIAELTTGDIEFIPDGSCSNAEMPRPERPAPGRVQAHG